MRRLNQTICDASRDRSEPASAVTAEEIGMQFADWNWRFARGLLSGFERGLRRWHAQGKSAEDIVRLLRKRHGLGVGVEHMRRFIEAFDSSPAR